MRAHGPGWHQSRERSSPFKLAATTTAPEKVSPSSGSQGRQVKGKENADLFDHPSTSNLPSGNGKEQEATTGISSNFQTDLTPPGSNRILLSKVEGGRLGRISRARHLSESPKNPEMITPASPSSSSRDLPTPDVEDTSSSPEKPREASNRCQAAEVASTTSTLKRTSTIFLQVRQGFESWLDLSPARFQMPCETMNVSGGTASFFKVGLLEGETVKGTSLTRFVGKDTAESEYEVEFYRKLQILKRDRSDWAEFAHVLIECGGVAKLECGIGPKSSEIRRLLLLQDMRGGFHNCRVLDIKLGQKTCVGGWKGRTRLDALKKAPLDKMSNSAVEGFRCEGMDNPPKGFAEYIEAMAKQSKDRSWLGSNDFVSVERLSRYTMQRLPGLHVLEAFFDFSMVGGGGEIHSHAAIWRALEELCKVVRTVVKQPVQMWIGSSIALCLEVGKLSESPKVNAKLFDWGRSELTTQPEYDKLDPGTRKERFQHWCAYTRALCRLHWGLFRLAAHRCCTPRFSSFVFELRYIQNKIMTKCKTDAGQIALWELDAKSTSGRVKLSFASSHHGTKQGSGDMQAMARLEFDVCIGESKGESSVLFGSLRVENVPKWEIASARTRAFSLHVIGFEFASDANQHVQAWQCGPTLSKPAGRACVRHTSPAKVQQSRLSWTDYVEFLGLGTTPAKKALHKLQSLWPKTGDEESPEEDGSCMQFLPAAIDNTDDQELEASSFCNLIAPWGVF